MSGSYLYGESRSVNDGGSSQATSNWRYNCHDGDPNAVPLAVSNFSPGHRFSPGTPAAAPGSTRSTSASASTLRGGRTRSSCSSTSGTPSTRSTPGTASWSSPLPEPPARAVERRPRQRPLRLQPQHAGPARVHRRPLRPRRPAEPLAGAAGGALLVRAVGSSTPDPAREPPRRLRLPTTWGVSDRVSRRIRTWPPPIQLCSSATSRTAHVTAAARGVCRNGRATVAPSVRSPSTATAAPIVRDRDSRRTRA